MEKIILENHIVQDNYTNYVCEKYDIQNNELCVTEIPMINMDELSNINWNIGVICGNSGSGKSTILNAIGEVKTPQYDFNKAIISQFPSLDEAQVCELLCSVGLSSVPIWLHKPNELSNGERARLDLAWVLANYNGETIFIDEFTSVVNRPCAQSLSHALQRYVRKNNIKIILSSCHFDIIDWLKPDWIFNLNKCKDGDVEIEHITYSDSYNVYSNVNSDDVLSKERNVVNS